jgi:hypothetical protein
MLNLFYCLKIIHFFLYLVDWKSCKRDSGIIHSRSKSFFGGKISNFYTLVEQNVEL